MPLPTISALPPAPSRNDDGETFADKADAFVAALPQLRSELNAYSAALTTEGIAGGGTSSIARSTAMCIGDSLIGNGYDLSTPTSKNAKARGWVNWICVALHQRIRVIDSFAAGGSRIDAIRAQFTDHIKELDQKPGWLFISAGGNDLLDDDSATAVDALKTKTVDLIADVLGAGIIPVILLGGAIDAALDNNLRSGLYSYFHWLRDYAAQQGNIVTVDGFMCVLDPTSLEGKPVPEYLFDANVHYSCLGAQIVGKKAAKTLAPLLPVVDPWYVSLNDGHGTTPNVSDNALLYGTGGGLQDATGQVADQFSVRGIGSITVACSKVAADADDDFQGEWQQIAVSAGVGGSYAILYTSENSGYSIGEELFTMMEVDAQGMTEMAGVHLELTCKDSGGGILARSRANIYSDPAEEMSDFSGVLHTNKIAVPAGTSYVQMALYITPVSGASAASATIKCRRNIIRKYQSGAI